MILFTQISIPGIGIGILAHTGYLSNSNILLATKVGIVHCWSTQRTLLVFGYINENFMKMLLCSASAVGMMVSNSVVFRFSYMNVRAILQ